MTTFINWSSVSTTLTNDRTRISTTRYPNKYKEIIEKIQSHDAEIKKLIDLHKKLTQTS